MGTTIMEEVTNSMKISSVKGLPRIISAHSPLHRTIWTVAVICFFGVCLLTVSLNIIQYLDYPKVVNVEEKPINHTDPNGTVPFPTVVVCNLNPYSSNQSAFEENGIPLPKDYYRKVKEITACVNCSKERARLAERARNTLMSSRGYYQYVGMDNMAKVSSLDLVLECSIILLSGSSLTTYPCDDFSTKGSFVHPEAGICYTYTTKPSNMNMVVGFSFMLHVDSSKSMNKEYSTSFYQSTVSGAAVYVNDPDSAFNFIGTGAIAAPGSYTANYLKVVRTDRLSKPYSDRECTDIEVMEKHIYNDRLLNYDIMSCFSDCNLHYIIEKCNCTDLSVIQYPLSKPPHIPFCATLTHSIDQLYKNINCSEKMRDKAYASCTQKCKEPCKEIKYVLTQASTKWPLPSQIESFYENVINDNVRLRQKYKKHLETAKAMAAGHKNISDVTKLLASKAIEENFLHMYVYLIDLYYTHYESKPKFTLDALISQLGGSFNLWSGITMMLVVEIIDLVIRIICRVQGGKNEEKKEALPLHTPPLANSEDSMV